MTILASLKHGQRAVITHVEADDDPRVCARLAARGLVPGTPLGVLRGGDPLLVGIDSERWAINAEEAARIHVDVLEKPRRFRLPLRRR